METVFGPDNIEYWLFEPKSFVKGCVVQDFCSRIGLDIGDTEVVRANDSLSLAALSLLYTHRKLTPGRTSKRFTPSFVKFIKKMQTMEGGGKLRFHSSLIAPLVEEARGEMEWMEARLGASLAEDLQANDKDAIKSEQDLLTYAPETLAWLAENVQDEAIAKRVLSGDPQDVANGMYELEVQLGFERRPKSQQPQQSKKPQGQARATSA